MVEHERELRSRLDELVAQHRGQRALAKKLGVSQPTISRFLAGGPLSPLLARAVARAFPILKPNVDAVFYGRDMHQPQAPSASGVA